MDQLTGNESQNVVTLMATILGALLGFGLTRAEQWFQQKPLSRNATMRLATDLRRWSNDVLWQLDENRIYVDSAGAAGSRDLNLPHFGFETALDQIALIKAVTATRTFELLHRRDEVTIEIKAIQNYGDDEESWPKIQSLIASLVLSAIDIYQRASREVGWPERFLTPDELERLNWKAVPLPRWRDIRNELGPSD